MAYWNPEQIDSYYDPYANTDAVKPSAVESLGQVAKTMVIMGGLNALGGAAAKWFSRSATKYVAARATGKLQALANKPGVSTLGDIFKNTSPAKQVINYYKKDNPYWNDESTKKYNEYFDEADKWLSKNI